MPGFKGDATAALRSIKVQGLIIGAKGDLLFDRRDLMQLKNTIPRAAFVEIDSVWGHAVAEGIPRRQR